MNITYTIKKSAEANSLRNEIVGSLFGMANMISYRRSDYYPVAMDSLKRVQALLDKARLIFAPRERATIDGRSWYNSERRENTDSYYEQHQH